jgi:hypothetical protein
MATSNFQIWPRYYWVLYPFVLVTVALGFARLPRVVGAAGMTLLLLVMVPNSLSALRPSNLDAALDYRGFDYLSNELRFVPEEDVALVNHWLDDCDELHAPRLLFRGDGLSESWLRAPPVAPELHIEGLQAAVAQGVSSERGLELLGMFLSQRMDRDEERLLRLDLPQPLPPALLRGFSAEIRRCPPDDGGG